jgi:RNA polymerase-binding transcription factor DksA
VRLAEERLLAQQRLSDLTRDFESVVSASRDTNADDEHDPEGATIAFERSQIAALTRQARQHIEEVDAALARLRAATYGLCETCGRAIAEDRLEARPAARTCIVCARVTRGRGG